MVGETVLLDTLPVEASSVSINPDVAFRLEPDHRAITFLETLPQDSVEICFRSVSEVIHRPVFNRDVNRYTAGALRERGTALSPIKEEEIFSFGTVSTFGAITRGVTFGNRQNVFVNSALNLQMEGNLSEDLKVSAVITDQNIPYQPEGNTQQIRDFDNVFIKLYNDQFEVIAGDIVLQNPVKESYFLKYYKNVQGLAMKAHTSVGKDWKSTSQVSGALAKGQFTSAVIQPQEGVQGPYKLRGANGERFIIVMANSERVYLDGRLLERGFDRDYVIDYNLGEITFSSAVIITRFSRIRVDYEFANQFYTRTNLSATQQLSNEHLSLYFNYYQEKDNPSNTLAFDLNESDVLNLRAAGDNGGIASISGVDSTAYIENAVLYQKRDTVNAEGAQVSIFQQSTDPEVAVFRISFSEVGTGNGDYMLANTTSNGRIYEWVGTGAGSYAPIQVIPTPNQKRMFVSGLRAKIGAYEQVYQELAISTLDQNLYSPIDDADNSGFAWKGGVVSSGREISFLPSYPVNAELTYEFDSRYFTFIDRFRSADYDRDWGYDVFADTLKTRQDQIFSAQVGLRKNDRNGGQYGLTVRNRAQVVAGVQQEFNLGHRIGPMEVKSSNFLMTNQLTGYHSEWLRSSQQIQLVDWVLRPGYHFSLDHNTTTDVDTEEVLSTLMYFDAHDFFVESGDSLKTTFRADYIRRKDKLPVDGTLSPYTEAEEYRFTMNSKSLTNHQVGAQLNYRKVKEQIGDRDTDENILGRVSWLGHFAKRHITSNLTFATANIRELKREFVFLNVATGEGTHTWRDENEDGIQDINEFYEAINPDEKTYIKLFTPTDEYINAYQSTYIHTLDVKMPEGWRDESGILPVLSRVSFNTNLKYDFKTTSQDLMSRLDPFSVDLSDEKVVSARNLYRHTLFYNRNAPGFGLDVTRSGQSSKSLLSGGFEVREKQDWLAAYRIGFGSVVTLRGRGGLGETVNHSDFLESRNFSLGRRTIESEVVWQPLNTFRLITGYGRRDKQRLEEGDENTQINEYKLEATWVRSGQGNLNASFTWLEIQFVGEINSYLGYELLEALQPGTNQKWNINWQQSLGKGLQLSLQYFGRKSAESAAVHTGSVQVTAYF